MLDCVKNPNHSCLPSFHDYNIRNTGGFTQKNDVKSEKSLQNEKEKWAINSTIRERVQIFTPAK